MYLEYANAPTQQLINTIDEIVVSTTKLNQSGNVNAALTRLREVCRKTPSIISYVERKLSERPKIKAFNNQQMQILMYSVIARSSSTYGTIPGVVSHLSLIGEHTVASILNENTNLILYYFMKALKSLAKP